MSSPSRNSGSFRDPAGSIYEMDGRILRAISQQGSDQYEKIRDSGLLVELTQRGLFVESKEIDLGLLPQVQCDYLLEHERIPFINYPYEWSFSLLKKAALHQLTVLRDVLEKDFTCTDATAYNVQFRGVTPVSIDHLSLRPYVEGEIWAAHRQFCMQFLNPLILWSLKGVSPNPWFRGSLEGIAPEDLSKLLSWHHNRSFTVLTHVTLQAALQRRAVKHDAPIGSSKMPTLSRSSFRGMLASLSGYVEGLRGNGEPTVWQDYADHNSYADEQAKAKRAFVARMIEATQPQMLFDLGCNSGDYSELALDAGAHYVVGFDYDFGALEAAIARAEVKNLPFLPLWLDAANPSPSQGWAGEERMSLAQRGNADALVALAFIHHIAIARNVPLGMAIDWIMSLAPIGVIEFPSKSDPMVQQLLANRPDIFPDYTEEVFLAEIRKRGRIVETARGGDTGRLLAWYDRA